MRGAVQRNVQGDKVYRKGKAPALRQPKHQAACVRWAGSRQHRSRRGASGRGAQIP